MLYRNTREWPSCHHVQHSLTIWESEAASKHCMVVAESALSWVWTFRGSYRRAIVGVVPRAFLRHYPPWWFSFSSFLNFRAPFANSQSTFNKLNDGWWNEPLLYWFANDDKILSMDMFYVYLSPLARRWLMSLSCQNKFKNVFPGCWMEGEVFVDVFFVPKRWPPPDDLSLAVILDLVG